MWVNLKCVPCHGSGLTPGQTLMPFEGMFFYIYSAYYFKTTAHSRNCYSKIKSSIFLKHLVCQIKERNFPFSWRLTEYLLHAGLEDNRIKKRRKDGGRKPQKMPQSCWKTLIENPGIRHPSVTYTKHRTLRNDPEIYPCKLSTYDAE